MGPGLHNGYRLENDRTLDQLTHNFIDGMSLAPAEKEFRILPLLFEPLSALHVRRDHTPPRRIHLSVLSFFVERGPDFHLESLNTLETVTDENVSSPSIESQKNPAVSAHP